MSRRLAPNKAALTMPVPVAAHLAGVGRSTAYNAVASGAFPGLEVCGRWVVLAEPFCRMFGIAPDDPRIAIAFEMAGYPVAPEVVKAMHAPTPRKKAKAKGKTSTRRVARKAEAVNRPVVTP